MVKKSWRPVFTEASPFCRVVSTELPLKIAKPIFASEARPHERWGENAPSGFTLIEVLMAAAILAIGLMGIAAVIARASVQDVRANHISRANFLMEEFLENATRAQYSAQTFNALTDTAASRVIDGVRFTMNCTLAENTPVERCKEMTCILAWDNTSPHASARYVYVFSPKF
ncbi:prepilin-type N-terminal cleavage/methylation domain-containing protein [Desulfomicrobium sp. ZS1]|uniref:prepilin-type N-terminal cleavage/methylation domain-containing protein n=1 Tax=Desulfomicrobium sp. ZS1 TaxID=2952228 RepID=UPI0020B458FD|nr:prepilin-type N-terminal cleavage/methylation domain-containing protein [Desulfomicrobium sp. ZS1]UTF50244.1 prepilin-type N-terminal cleavage/methylation domain-containing protein [Desulfomicrobium sp. ZS1]